MKKSENIILGLGILCILLLLGIFQWGNYLISNNFLQEGFSENLYSTHNVNLPINTSYSCSNFCGPPGRCSKTGQQCLADIDCPGCQPYSPPLRRINKDVPGENDAGKITTAQYPTFSSLTTDIGTQAKIFRANNVKKGSPQANFGPNLWRNKYNKEEELFDERYKPKVLKFMRNYPYRYTLSGEFLTNGPLPANAYINEK